MVRFWLRSWCALLRRYAIAAEAPHVIGHELMLALRRRSGWCWGSITIRMAFERIGGIQRGPDTIYRGSCIVLEGRLRVWRRSGLHGGGHDSDALAYQR